MNTVKGQELSLNAGFDALKETYPNYIEGPLDVIKNMTTCCCCVLLFQ